jgi:hypothetical protein
VGFVRIDLPQRAVSVVIPGKLIEQYRANMTKSEGKPPYSGQMMFQATNPGMSGTLYDIVGDTPISVGERDLAVSEMMGANRVN